jgi:hypothetical protein
MNRTRRFALIGLISLAAIGSAQAWSWSIGYSQRIEGTGDLSTEQRELSSFDAIALEGGFKVQIRQGAADKVEVRADRNLLPYLETRVVDGKKGRTLEISTKKGYSISAKETPLISLDMRQLRAVAVAGSGEINVAPFKAEAVEASVAGSGDIRFADLQAQRLGLSVAGSGDVAAAGRVATLKVSVAGSGDVKARDLVSEEAKVSISGSGDVSVQALKKLRVSIAGSGDVAYAGSPEISTSIAGSGAVRKISP